jgi:hypothetical protein
MAPMELSMIKGQIKLQNLQKGAPTNGVKRKRPKSKSNLNIIQDINNGEKEVSVQLRQNHRGF